MARYTTALPYGQIASQELIHGPIESTCATCVVFLLLTTVHGPTFRANLFGLAQQLFLVTFTSRPYKNRKK